MTQPTSLQSIIKPYQEFESSFNRNYNDHHPKKFPRPPITIIEELLDRQIEQLNQNMPHQHPTGFNNGYHLALLLLDKAATELQDTALALVPIAIKTIFTFFAEPIQKSKALGALKENAIRDKLVLQTLHNYKESDVKVQIDQLELLDRQIAVLTFFQKKNELLASSRWINTAIGVGGLVLNTIFNQTSAALLFTAGTFLIKTLYDSSVKTQLDLDYQIAADSFRENYYKHYETTLLDSNLVDFHLLENTSPPRYELA